MKTNSTINNEDRNRYRTLIEGLKNESDQEKVIKIVKGLENSRFIDIDHWNLDGCVWNYMYEEDDEDGFPSEVIIDVGRCSNMDHDDPDQAVFTPEDLAKANIKGNTISANYTYHGQSSVSKGTATITLYDYTPHIIE